MTYIPTTVVGVDPYRVTPRAIHFMGPTLQAGPNATDTAVAGAAVLITDSPANALAASQRFGFTAAAGLNSSALCRQSNGFLVILGDAAPLGGFRMTWRFGIDTGGTFGSSAFAGLYSSIAAQPYSGPADPSSIVNMICMAYDDTDANWQIMHNDASGTANKIDLTSDFVVNATSLYELVLESEPSSGIVTYDVKDLSLDRRKTGSISTELPAGTVPLTPALQICSRATGVAQRICHISRIIEAGPGA